MEDPRWLTGSGVTYVDGQKQTVRYRVAGEGTVTLAPEHNQTRVDIDVDGGLSQVTVTGSDVPKLTRVYLHVEGDARALTVNVAEKVQLETLAVEVDERPPRLVVHADAKVITIPAAAHIELSGPSQSAGCDEVVVVGGGEVSVGGELPIGRLTAAGVSHLILRAPTPGVISAASARLDLQRSAIDTRVHAREMYLQMPATRLVADVAGAVECRAAIDDCEVVCDSLLGQGPVTNCELRANSIDLQQSARESTICADGQVAIAGVVDGCTVHGKDAVVLNGTRGAETRTPYEATVDSVTAGLNPTYNAVTKRSTIRVTGEGVLIAGSLEGCTVHASGEVRVHAGVEFGQDETERGRPSHNDEPAITGRSLSCHQFRGDLGRLDLRHLHVNGDATFTGQLQTDPESIVVLGGAETSTGATLGAERLVVRGQVVGPFVLRGREVELGQFDTVKSLTVKGASNIDTAERTVKFTAGVKSATLDLDGDLAGIVVPVGTHLKATPTLEASFGQMTLDGTAEVLVHHVARVAASIDKGSLHVKLPRLKSTANQNHPGSPSASMLDVALADGACLALCPEEDGSGRLDVRLDLKPVRAGGGASRRLKFGSGRSFRSSAPPRTSAEDAPLVALRADTPWSVDISVAYAAKPPTGPTLNLDGPLKASLAGDFRYLEAPRDARRAPIVAMPDVSGRVSAASGHISVQLPFLGRLDGNPRRRARVFRPESRACEDDLVVTNVVPQLKGTQHDADEPGRDGVLRDVDLTNVHYQDLDHLRQLHILDPTPASIREFASGRGVATDGEGDRFRQAVIRDRAEWMTKLASITENRAISGASRTSVRWAEARLQHLSNPKPSVESVARFLFARPFGYGVRPGPPLVTLLAAYSIVVLLRIGRWHHLNSANPGLVGSGYEWWAAMRDAVLLPLSFLRLGDSVQLFWSDFYNAIAFAGLVLPLLGTVVAMRSYLRDSG